MLRVDDGPLEPLLIDARRTAELLSVSPRTLWSQTNSQQIPSVRIGRRVLYPVAALHAWVAEITTAPRQG
jgi:excisionase family DNA binding protein